MTVSVSKEIRWTRIFKALLIILVILFGVELRVTSSIETVVDKPIRADALNYMRYSANLVRFGVYTRKSIHEVGGNGELEPDFLRPPGYPIFISLFFNSDLEQFVGDLVIGQALLSGLVGILLFMVAYQLGGYTTALIVVGLYATAPHIISINANILSESLMSSLLIIFLTIFYAALKFGQWHYWILAGIVLAFAALTRPYLTLFGLPLLVFLWIFGNPEYRSRAMSMFLASSLILGGWAAYAKIQSGKESYDLFSLNVYHGIYPGMKYEGNDRSLGYPYLLNPRHKEISASLEATINELKRRINNDPWKYVNWYLVGKPMMLWQWSLVQGNREIFPYPVLADPWEKTRFRSVLEFHRFAHVPTIILAILGCLLVWTPTRWVESIGIDSGGPERIFLRGVSLLLVYGTLVHLLGAPLPRYHIPQLPLVFLMAALASQSLLIAIVRRMGRTYNPRNNHDDNGTRSNEDEVRLSG